ncbi:choline transporter-like 2 isoform X2 [Achroia grisella]|uniref:choline transporter-like 2 isoform X2 n=1 Tax=Achroia grisella TaxID=688607 RepID=UPI0027D29582|nr:choline transporter-like 2 isoform X2 [Achroia grisella]
MEKEYGKPIRYDPHFNGPTHNRSCTDIIWLIVFILYMGAWGYVGYYGKTHGDIETLLAPMDSMGRRCGLNSYVEDKKYLVFFDISQCLRPDTPISGCPTKQVCVKECPKETIVFDTQLTPSSFATLKSSMVCTIDVDMNTLTYDQAKRHIEDGTCAKYVLKSQSVLFRCIGDLSDMPKCKNVSTTASSIWRSSGSGDTCVRNPKEAQKSLFNSATALDSYVGWIAASWVSFFTNNQRDAHILSAQIVQDLVQSRWYMAGGVVAVVVICFTYILLLRWVVAPVVWFSIAGFIALLGFAVYVCYTNYKYYLDNPVHMASTSNLLGYTQSIFTKHQTWMAILIITAIILVIMLLIVIFLRGRIVIAIALIKEGSKAVTAIKSTVLFPIFPWLLQCLVIAYGIFVCMSLMSIGESTFKVVNLKNDTNCQCNKNYTDYVDCKPPEFTSSCQDSSSGSPQACKLASCHFSGLNGPTGAPYLHLVNVLGFFWMMFFISGVSDMMLASTFSTWYWTLKKRNLPFFTLTSGIYRTIRYHLGTVAIGALIIAIVRVIRVCLEYIDQKVKKFDNPFTRCVLCCCKCFFWCLENFLKFINKNAYIMCAVHGSNFCTSAKDAFSLLMRNIVRVVVLDKVADFIFFLSRLLISVGVAFAVYYLLQWNYVYEVTQGGRLHYNYIPAIILGVVTYLICSIFFNVYSMAVDTLFLCFLEDFERNDGTKEKPYFASKNLMKILGKENQRAE